MLTRAVLLVAALLPACLIAPVVHAEPGVTVDVVRAPEGGVQPQACVDGQGTLHLIYGKAEGDSPRGHGNLYYVTQKVGQGSFSPPVRVNTQPHTLTLAGVTGGCQMALGQGGRVHVVWNGPHPGKEAPAQEKDKKPLFYTRLNDAGTGFEPERDLSRDTEVLDGGATVAADGQGRVHVLWHARGPQKGEAHRCVYQVSSADNGQTFGDKSTVSPPDSGTCVCCSMRATADAQGGLYATFRAAGQNTHRDTLLLYSPRPGEPFKALNLGRWVVNYCPASSYGLATGPRGVRVAWEQKGVIHFTAFDPQQAEPPAVVPVSDPNKAGSKYPVVATNSKGQTLVAWSQGVSFFSGGSVEWRILSESNTPTEITGQSPGVPASGQATAYARPDGSFVVVY